MSEQNMQQTNQQGPMMPNWNIPTANIPWWINPWLYYPQGNVPTRTQDPSAMMQRVEPQNQQSRVDYQPQQQVQEQPKMNTVPCGIISSESDITPGDVPMNGGFGMFMQKDLSAIYIKQWQSDGKIYTKKYIESVEEAPVMTVTPVDQTSSRLDRLEDGLLKLYSAIEQMQAINSKGGGTKTAKKEGLTNE